MILLCRVLRLTVTVVHNVFDDASLVRGRIGWHIDASQGHELALDFSVGYVAKFNVHLQSATP
jgi:hypothetical protein